MDKFVHLVRIFICFAHQWTSWVFGIFSRCHTTFELGKPLNNLCSSHFLLSKPYMQHFEEFCSIIPQLKQNLMQTCCSFKSAIFLVHQNCKWNTTHLYLTRHYLTVACATTLFQTGNDSADSTLSTTSHFFNVKNNCKCKKGLGSAHPALCSTLL
jgi:hypothetical protein